MIYSWNHDHRREDWVRSMPTRQLRVSPGARAFQGGYWHWSRQRTALACLAWIDECVDRTVWNPEKQCFALLLGKKKDITVSGDDLFDEIWKKMRSSDATI